MDAASESRVTEELKKKISRERIGKELMLMLGTRRFSYAMECIYQVNLWDAVFKFPDDISEAFEWDPLQSLSCLTNLERVLALRTGYFGGISDCGISCAEVPRPTQCALLAALFVPIAECQFLTPKRKFESLVSFIMLSSIKFTSKDTATVTAFLSHRPKFVALIADRSAWTRRTAGRLIHDAGEHWRDVFYLALASVLPPIPLKKGLSPERPTLELNAEGKRLLECYDAFAKYVDDEALGNAWSLKTLFNGKQVASMLSTRTGPWVTCALSKLLEWQFDNPAATADEARAWVVENKEMLTIPPTPTTPASPSSSVPSSPTS